MSQADAQRERFREADRACKRQEEALVKLYAGMTAAQLKEVARLRKEMERNWAKARGAQPGEVQR